MTFGNFVFGFLFTAAVFVLTGVIDYIIVKYSKRMASKRRIPKFDFEDADVHTDQ